MAYKLTYQQFADGLKQNKLLGLKCQDCSSVTAPPKLVCAGCGGENLLVENLTRRGVIRTYTIIRVPPEGFQPDNIIALVELEEGPWVMGSIENFPAEKASMDLIGEKVELGHKVIPGDTYSAGERIAITFTLEARQSA